MRLRTAEGVLVPALFAYAADEFGDEFFDEAWEEFFLWDAVPDDIDDSREFGTTVQSVLRLLLRRPTPPRPNYRQAGRLSPSPCTFSTSEVESCPTSTASSSSKRAGATRASLSSNRPRLANRSNLKDILTGRHFHVLEQSASGMLRTGDLHLHARRHGRRRQHHARCLAVGHSAIVAPARHRVPRPALSAPAHDTRGSV